MVELEGPNDGQETNQLDPAWAFVKEGWVKPQQKTCRKLVGIYRNQIPAVIKNKGYVIDYLRKTMDKGMNDFEHGCF